MRDIERRMLGLRGDRARRTGGGLAQAVSAVDALLATAQDRLGGEGLAPASAFAFTASLVILLREGLEAGANRE